MESGGPIPMPDYQRGAPQRRIGGFAGLVIPPTVFVLFSFVNILE